jgi:hypothetical protein
MPEDTEKIAATLRGKGFVIDCASSLGNPSHSFMGVTQAGNLIDWLKRTNESIEWIITRGCSMHVGSAVSGALQMSMDNILFQTRFLSDKKVLMWDVPVNSSSIVCFDHGIVNPHYASFPPLRWRDFITRRLNMLIGFVPSLARPCLGAAPNVKVGVYYRSGTRNVNKLRRMCNLDAMLAGIGNLVGPENVATFTTNETMSLLAQVQLFDAHDVLVGPHGSQWAMSWFAERPRAIIEVQAVFGVFELRMAIMTKGRGHHFLVSSGHELAHHNCRPGPEAELTAHARRLCAPQNFDGTSPLCSGRPAESACAFRPCEARTPDERNLLLDFKYQSTRVNVTAMREHVAAAVRLLGLQPCAP